MVQKKAPAAASQPASQDPAKEEAAPPASEAAPPSTEAKATEEAPSGAGGQSGEPVSEPATEDPYATAASELATGAALEEKIKQIMEMGFPKDEVIRALRAAFNNPDRAVEYLMTGLPPEFQAASEAGQAAQGAPGDTRHQHEQEPRQENEPFNMFAPGQPAAPRQQASQGPLSELRANPRFRALRAMVQANPEFLQPMLQELGRNNPSLLMQINANQQEFLAMLNEPLDQGEEAGVEEMLRAMMSEGGGGGEGGEESDRVMQIELTEEEVAAIDRLAGLGFHRDACIEAFLICDKNEEAAANYLLENAGDM
jgi:UV excision repair protein RAD23